MKNQKSAKILMMYFIFILFISTDLACNKESNSNNADIDYSHINNWAYYPLNSTRDVDVFFVAPTIYGGTDSIYNMPINDPVERLNFIGAINMEKGIYDEGDVNFYAPFYRQASFNCYGIRAYNDVSSDENVNAAFELAYGDVEDAFNYYFTESDKPFILAGFSQGAEMIIKLIKNNFDKTEAQKRFIAAYAIGWRLDSLDVQKYEYLKAAKSDIDLGVVISYSSEANFIDSSIIVPKTTMSINPLSWNCDTTLASKGLNLGACFTDYSGIINKEIPEFTSAYIKPGRGTLVVPDVDPLEYPPVLPIFVDGEYHIYDYLFFYRNLQENVDVRIEEYLKNK